VAKGLRKELRWAGSRCGCNMALCLLCPLQAVNPGRSLFLLYALKSSPRLGLLYLYLFDYTDTFLPFLHTICPLQEDGSGSTSGSGDHILSKLLVSLQVPREGRRAKTTHLQKKKGHFVFCIE
jgi:hypothetical protein